MDQASQTVPAEIKLYWAEWEEHTLGKLTGENQHSPVCYIENSCCEDKMKIFFHKIILSINTNLQAKHMVSLQNLPGSLDTTDLPGWVIAKLGFAVLSWEIQCLSSALYLSESNWDLPAPEERLCQWDMGCFGSEHFAVCPGGFSVYVEKP